jgi:hypothetical protein
MTKSGISKVYFTELPKEVQQRFGYNPEKATAYTAEQNAALDQARMQQEEAMRQRQEATARNSKDAAEQEAARKQQRDNAQELQSLQARYNELQKQEDDLSLQVGEAEHRRYHDLLRTQLPLLRNHLKDVRNEKERVRQQLQQAQR